MSPKLTLQGPGNVLLLPAPEMVFLLPGVKWEGKAGVLTVQERLRGGPVGRDGAVGRWGEMAQWADG